MKGTCKTCPNWIRLSATLTGRCGRVEAGYVAGQPYMVTPDDYVDTMSLLTPSDFGCVMHPDNDEGGLWAPKGART